MLSDLVDAARQISLPDVDRSRLRSDIVRRAGAAALAVTVPAATASAAAGGVAAGTAGGTVAATASSATGGTLLKALAVLSILGAAGGGASFVVRERAKSHVTASVSSASVSPAARVDAPPATAQEETQPAPPEMSTASVVATPPAPIPASPRTAARIASAPRPSAVAASSSAGSLEEELSLIGHAQDALNSGRAASALALLDKHAALYPKGQLAEEREGMRVLANCSLGRPEARRKADQFLRSRPQSPLATRIRKACDS
jgi:RNA polymerase sigma-70 factor (ECF subfamily)